MYHFNHIKCCLKHLSYFKGSVCILSLACAFQSHFLLNSKECPFDALANVGESANHFLELGVPLLRGRQRAAAAPQQPEVELRPKQVRYERVLRLVGASERQGKCLVDIDFVVGNLRFDSMEFGESHLSYLTKSLLVIEP